MKEVCHPLDRSIIDDKDPFSGSLGKETIHHHQQKLGEYTVPRFVLDLPDLRGV